MLNPIKMGFRELNHSKIDRLTKANCSDATIASSMNDEMIEKEEKVRFTADDIASYKKITKYSSKMSLVSEKKVDAFTEVDLTNSTPELA
jgi:hypothetical protein